MKHRILLALIATLTMLSFGHSGRVSASKSTAPVSLDSRASSDGMFVADLAGDFSPDALKGVDLALNALSAQIHPTVPVEVKIEMTQLDPRFLGRGGGAASVRNFPGAPLADTWYPQSLANSLAGTRLVPAPDGMVQLNSVMPWDYSGQPQAALKAHKPDFVTTVTHEVLHTMGIQGTALITPDNQGEVGDSDGVIDEESHNMPWHTLVWTGPQSTAAHFTCVVLDPVVQRTRTADDDLTPDIWDRFIVNGEGEAILDGSLADPSPDLDVYLTSDDLFWSGPAGMAANGGKPVKIYAPSTWQQGSSYAHLDDGTFDGGSDALMTAAGANIPDISIGPRLVGILQDMGWNANSK